MWRWAAILAGLLAFILVPFALFDEPVSAWTLQTIRGNPEAAFVWIVLALALDVFLPIPSSIVSTLGGAILGFGGGFAASTIGMSLGSVLGYWFGAVSGLRKAIDAHQAFDLQERYGIWALLLSRPVPVLAEASVIAAGFSRMPFRRFLLVTTLSNIGISAAYAYAGGNDSFWMAFAGAIGIPLVAKVVVTATARATK